MAAYSNSLVNHTTENYLKHANFVFSDKNSSPIMSMLDPQPGQAIIDLGAGTGQLTEKIKLAVGESGTVVGVDSSEDMVGRGAFDKVYAFVLTGSSSTQMSTQKDSISDIFAATFKTSKPLTRLLRGSLTLYSHLPLSTGARPIPAVLLRQ